MPDRDEFYVGYFPKAPERLGHRTRWIATGLVSLTLVVALLLAAGQDRADPGSFDYGHHQELFGQLRTTPYPMLLAPGRGLTDRDAIYTRYLLVAEGKHGAQPLTDSLDGQWVKLTGTRIHRGHREMLEIASGGVQVVPPAPNVRLGIPVPAAVSRGQMRLVGEVVDSKCWLGVMKPATGTVHRGCATRCLSGGIPPLLMLRDSTGATVHLLLTGAGGEPATRRFLPLVGQEVALTGEVIEEGDLLLMRVATIERDPT
jgi:hypothetical protein